MIIHNEDGFTLVEILISLYILGLLAYFTIPLFIELKEYERQQAIQVEASSWLQERMERLRSGNFFTQTGKSERKSKVIGKLTYFLNWTCTEKQNHLYHIEVEIQWRDGRHQRKLTLCTDCFTRY